MSTQDSKFLKARLLQRPAALLLGAGFSFGAKNLGGNDLLMGIGLAEKLYNHFYVECPPARDDSYIDNVSYYKKDLRKICSILRSENRQEIRDAYLTNIFSGCHLSGKQYQCKIRSYEWDTIFTLNIDDLVENIFAAAGTSLCVWNYKENGERRPHSQTLIKLHGDIHSPQDGFVFDDEEYSKFASNNNCLLKEFAHVFFSKDMVILGSEFQESDISFVLNLYESAGYKNNDCHYFFVVPRINDIVLRNKIENIDNFHWVEMDTEMFLTFVSEEIVQTTNDRNLLKERGAVFVDELPVRENYMSEIYSGKSAQYDDFFGEWDIIYPNQKALIQNTLERHAPVTIITLFGKPYNGKTVVAKRCLMDLKENGYIAIEIPHMEHNVYESLSMYLSRLSEESNVALLIENAAYQYEHIVIFANEHFNIVNHLVIITTDSSQNHMGRSHHLLNLPEQIEWLDFKVSERITSEFAAKIFYKLCVKKRLNNYLKYCHSRTHPTETNNMYRILDEMLRAEDIINVLYFSSEGKFFREYYVDWFKRHQSALYNDYLYVLAGLGKLGISAVPLHVLPQLVPLKAANFRTDDFLECYPDILEVKNGYVKLLRSRLMGEVLTFHFSDTLQKALHQLVRYTIGLFSEGDKSEAYEIFQKALRVKRIRHYSLLSPDQIERLFVSLEKYCTDISYFRVQYGLSFQLVGRFSEANNQFLYAQNIRPNSYQVAHALAKNRMEIGLDDLRCRRSSADDNFQLGCMEMENIINSPKYSRGYSYSVHSYFDMIKKFYQVKGQVIPSEKCEKLHSFFRPLLEMQIDSRVQNAIIEFLRYCQHLNIPQYCEGLEKVWKIKPRIIMEEDYIDIEE